MIAWLVWVYLGLWPVYYVMADGLKTMLDKPALLASHGEEGRVRGVAVVVTAASVSSVVVVVFVINPLLTTVVGQVNNAVDCALDGK